MKFAHFTDLHLANKHPGTRTDDYSKVSIEKLAFVYEEAYNNGCEFIVFTGDFFNESSFCRYDLLKQAKDIIKKSKIPTYFIVGEHDLVGHSFTKYDESPIKYLCQELDNFIFVNESIDLGKVVLWAKHKVVGVEGEFPVYNNVDTSKLNVLLCHDLVGKTKILGKGSRMLMTSDYPNLPFDIVCCGDLHDGFESHKINKTWFVNPGSLMRKTVKDINRKPKFYVIDINKGSDPLIKTVYYDNASNGQDIFTRKEKKETMSRSLVSDVIKSLDANKVVIKKFETLFNEYKDRNTVDADVVAIFNTMFNSQKG